jgi:hypothetical protein
MAGHILGHYTVVSRKNENAFAHFLIRSVGKTIEMISSRQIQPKRFCTLIKQISTYTMIQYKQYRPCGSIVTARRICHYIMPNVII